MQRNTKDSLTCRNWSLLPEQTSGSLPLPRGDGRVQGAQQRPWRWKA